MGKGEKVRKVRISAGKRRFVAAAALAVTLSGFGVGAIAQTELIGVVVMHGKGGSPNKFVTPLAAGLERNGYLVANIEMPWSGRRQYDVDVAAADKEVDAALEALRAKGAKKVFVAGHSQGGVFVLHYGVEHPVDGIIAIAPGGSVANQFYAREVAPSVERARRLVAEGKGNEKTKFDDFEGAKGHFPVITTAASYVSWFDPQGAMNQMKSSKSLPSQVPVLFVGPTNDYVALQRIKGMMFGALPANPRTRLYEPVASHVEAPAASLDEIVRWTKEVVAASGT
jgi:pimeloyl-ACP methyl ester carboxylesterase